MRKSIAILLAILMLFTLFQGALRENVVRADTKLGLEYIIVVANPSLLKDTVHDFVKFKESQGFDVIVEDVPTIEQNYQGIDRVEKIRNFLKDKVKGYPKTFTLLIGTPYDKNQANSISTGGDIPMRYIWPPKYYSTSPNDYYFSTDFYYCDLKGDWDSNKNGVFGEKDELNGIDYKVTNYVGRIPFSDSATVKKILDNTISLRKTPLTMKCLLASMQFADPNYSYLVGNDLSKWEEDWRTNILEPAGFTVTTLYEKESDTPSKYSCTAPFNEENFNKYLCDNDIIVTSGHDGRFREVWKDANNNKIIDPGEVKMVEFYSLDDLKSTKCHIKIWFFDGCFDAFKSWKRYYNTDNSEPWFVTADGILASTVAGVVIGSTDSPPPSPEGMDTLFKMLINDHKPIGEWLYYRFKENIGDISNVYYLTLNILGDPSFGLFDDSLTISADVTSPVIQIATPINGTLTKDSTVTVSGTITDDLSGIQKVMAGKQSVILDTNGSFTTNIISNEGPNDISIIATDKAGNTSTTTLTIYYKWKQMIVLTLTIGNPYLLVNLVPQEIDPGRGTTPVIKNGRTLVPIRAIVDALGGTVDWDGNERKVTVSLGSTTIELWIGKNTARVNGTDTPIDSSNSKVVPEIINGRTMLPLRFVTENLGCQLQWDPNTKTITITYKG